MISNLASANIAHVYLMLSKIQLSTCIIGTSFYEVTFCYVVNISSEIQDTTKNAATWYNKFQLIRKKNAD